MNEKQSLAQQRNDRFECEKIDPAPILVNLHSLNEKISADTWFGRLYKLRQTLQIKLSANFAETMLDVVNAFPSQSLLTALRFS